MSKTNQTTRVLGSPAEQIEDILRDATERSKSLLPPVIDIYRGQLRTGKIGLTIALRALDDGRYNHARTYIQGVIAGSELALEYKETEPSLYSELCDIQVRVRAIREDYRDVIPSGTDGLDERLNSIEVEK